MSSVRRSTRLSNVGAQITVPTTPNRRSEVWRLRQPKKEDTSDDSEEESLPAPSLVVLKERNANRGVSKSNSTMEKKNRKSTACIIEAGMKTPQSRTRPVSLSKKKEWLEAANKRKTDTTKMLANEGQEASPPKVSRQEEQEKSNPKPHQLQLFSPSRLIDRLSIDKRTESSSENENDDKEEKTSQSQSQLKKELTSPSRNKYQNARRVLNSAETKHLPGREQQLEELRNFLTEHIEEKRSGSLYVSGQPGTGKTACLSLLLRSPDFAKRLQCVYINCTSIASVGSVYKKLCTELKITPNGRTERDHLDAIKRYLNMAKRMVLIVLDEIDQLCSTRQSVLYTIFEWPALPGAKLLLIGIANSLDLTDRALIRLNARVELKPRLMHFPPYTKQQIVEIFRARLVEADVLDVFPPVTLQLLAAKVSAISGDVRRALDIGRRVVEIAEQQKKAGKNVVDLNELNIEDRNEAEKLKPVQVTQVVEVLNKVYGASQNLEVDIEGAFPLQQKLMLCTLMLMLRKGKNKDITIGRLHEVYRRVCNKRNICALDQAEFAGLVDLVETRGILRLVRKKEPRLSKVQLQWDEDEVNGALCDKQLIATILDDTACL